MKTERGGGRRKEKKSIRKKGKESVKSEREKKGTLMHGSRRNKRKEESVRYVYV